MEKPKSTKQKQSKTYHNYVRYSGLAIQMAVAIYLGHLLGEYIDHKTGNTEELYENIITLVAIFLSIFMVIRQVTKSNSSEQND